VDAAHRRPSRQPRLRRPAAPAWCQRPLLPTGNSSLNLKSRTSTALGWRHGWRSDSKVKGEGARSPPAELWKPFLATEGRTRRGLRCFDYMHWQLATLSSSILQCSMIISS
jgi:hypothetical protein